MELYRLTQKKFADSPFSPIGAKLFGGRWNSKGTEALYFAESESLCALEVFVHVNNDPNIITQYDLYRINIPDELIVKLDNEDLPPSWRDIPVSEPTQEIGDQFLTEVEPHFAALQVPSTISPRDHNYVVNPNHSALVAIFEQHEKLEFEFDPRIFK
ncbi:RES family NAD+ phosphorylase [Vibrio sp. ZSDE26]|uniref:RES family NAD+ phosphorylase n=1 Tax=Vibrio amylolyticus TaxID=2847292 RepID=A0A9X1XKM5_9VIBR|nr:RES family NAD+ phosphorylase [Vibrio amylolyticus]MCK6265017.1 RES family NAD+ phosphorylase [Vibrio amylolyticus]